MNLLSVNPYDAEVCKQIVLEKFDSKIHKKFNTKWLTYDFRKFYSFDEQLHKRETPRLGLLQLVMPCSSFYYLNFLCDIESDKIIDIGCGMNYFKDILPNVIGIDYAGEEVDIVDFFDKDFSTQNKNQFKLAFSIDSLHFISITEFYERIMDFQNIIEPGGRGYVSLNVARMIEHTPNHDLLNLFDDNSRQPNPTVVGKIASYIDQQIRKLPLTFLVVDNLINERYDEYIDGNIRLVFEK